MNSIEQKTAAQVGGSWAAAGLPVLREHGEGDCVRKPKLQDLRREDLWV